MGGGEVYFKRTELDNSGKYRICKNFKGCVFVWCGVLFLSPLWKPRLIRPCMKSVNVHSCMEGFVLFLNKVVGLFTRRQIPALLKSEDYRKKTRS